VAEEPVRALNTVVFPTLGRPINPISMLFYNPFVNDFNGLVIWNGMK
jgi:hypothetical protein